MTIDEALAFLSQHQPLPPDSALTEELIVTYDEVRKLFLHQSDPRCVPLLLHSFGDGSGFGVYQLIEDVIKLFSPDIVIPQLIDGMRSQHFGVRYWCIQIAALFPDVALIPELSLALADSDSDIRVETITTLTQIKEPIIEEILRNALLRETDEDVRNHIREAIGLAQY